MPRNSWIIGSESSCDLVVDNSAVSQRHCQLSKDGSTVILEDLGSTNGTFVNGQQINGPIQVTPTDRITLGQTEPLPWPVEFVASPPQNLPTESPSAPTASELVITIGRGPKNDLVLDETNVSTQHARLTIGANGITLEDLGSTNGTSVGKVEHKIQRAVVKPEDTIFFGSTSYRVADLIAQASVSSSIAVPNERSVAPAITSAQRKSKQSKPGSLFILGGGVVGLLIVVMIAWMALSDRTRRESGTDVTASAKTWSRPVDAAKPASVTQTENAESNPTASDTLATGGEPTDSGSTERVLTAEEKRERSLFVLVCSDLEGRNQFRLGTAFAVDATHFATSASVIHSMRDFEKNGFPIAVMFCPATNADLEVISMRAHPQYELAKAAARKAQEKHDSLYEAFKSKPVDVEQIENATEELLSERLKAIEAMERMTAFDVGVVEVQGRLDHWFSGSDSDAFLRPNQKLTLTGFAIDGKDPFFVPADPIELMSLSVRVRQVAKGADDSPERLLADCPQQDREDSYFGSPAINSQGQVVAVYSRPTPSPIGSNEEAAPNDPKPPETFDAPLFERIKECLANRP